MILTDEVNVRVDRRDNQRGGERVGRGGYQKTHETEYSISFAGAKRPDHHGGQGR